MRVRRAFADTPLGQLHYAEAGDPNDPVVLLLHQTPRSWDEYRDVLPLLGRRHRAIAMDTIGFGDSAKDSRPGSIGRYAEGAVALLDTLGIARAAVVGHHTGGVVAVELATAYPERVDRLVLSSTPYVDAALRRERAGRPPVDAVEPCEDGSHLTRLWQARMAFYPRGRADLLARFVLDALKAGAAREEGHLAVGTYEMERRIGRVAVPVLLIGATDDPFAYPHLRPLAEQLPGCRVVELAGGVPLPDQLPDAFARAVLDFLSVREEEDHATHR